MGKGNFSPFCTESRPPTYSSISNNSISDVGVRLNGKQLSRPPTSCSIANNSITDVGVRLTCKRKPLFPISRTPTT